MSASPAERTPGRTPNGTLPPLIRRPKNSDPLVRPKDRHKRRPPRPLPGNLAGGPNGTNGAPQPNGVGVPRHGTTHTIAQHPRQPALALSQRTPHIWEARAATVHSGFSSPALADYVDYPLVMTKRQVMEGMRAHVAKFYSKKSIDPRDQEEFSRPVRLLRRDPRAPSLGEKAEDAAEGLDSKAPLEEELEKERLEALKAIREAERDAEAAKEAPSRLTGAQKRGGFKKKTEQVMKTDETEEQRQSSKLTYEEALPWHLEDFDGKHTWVGSYEAAMSHTYAQLTLKDGTFQITPLEKWYKFSSKPIFKTLSIEEAEKHMSSKVTGPRWLMATLNEAKEKKANENKKQPQVGGLYRGKINLEDDTNVGGLGVKREADDADELDFEEDRFADDEENPLFEGDAEDAKDAEQRIKRDQLQANIFNMKDEKAYAKADMIEKRHHDAKKVLGKKVKRALMKREKNYIYDSDSDDPYSSHSDSDDTEMEQRKAEEAKKELEEKKSEERKAAEKLKAIPASGASTKGTNTPSHRPGKHLDAAQRPVSSTSQKRPGSPNLSEASGNESTRKKPKKKHATSSNLATGVSTPNGPVPRTRSPAPPTSSAPEPTTGRPTPPPQLVQRKNERPGTTTVSHKRDRLAGSGSDGEAASGGEMSDRRNKRPRLKANAAGSKSGSPRGSRAASPDARPVNPAPPPRFPTAAEIKAVIPPEGTTIKALSMIFRQQIQDPVALKRFTELLKSICRVDKATKALFPKD